MTGKPPHRLTRGDVLTAAQAADILGVSTRHVYNLTARDEMPGARRLGRRVVYSHQALQDWLAG